MYTYLKTLAFELKEQRRVRALFYLDRAYRQKDQALLKTYRGLSPYHICRDYLIGKGEKDPYKYGETPLTTLHRIVHEFGVGTGDTVLELGAGRGRAALFLAQWVGCKVIAVECIPLFIQLMIPQARLEVIEGDIQAAPFERASCVFLYGTMLADEEIVDLAQKIPRGVKVITVSYPLSDYSGDYKSKRKITGRFPWGKTEIHLNERII